MSEANNCRVVLIWMLMLLVPHDLNINWFLQCFDQIHFPFSLCTRAHNWCSKAAAGLRVLPIVSSVQRRLIWSSLWLPSGNTCRVLHLCIHSSLKRTAAAEALGLEDLKAKVRSQKNTFVALTEFRTIVVDYRCTFCVTINILPRDRNTFQQVKDTLWRLSGSTVQS